MSTQLKRILHIKWTTTLMLHRQFQDIITRPNKENRCFTTGSMISSITRLNDSNYEIPRSIYRIKNL